MKTTSSKILLTILSILISQILFSQTIEDILSKKAIHPKINDSLNISYEKDSLKMDSYRILIKKGKAEYIKVLKNFIWFEEKNEEIKKEIITTLENDLEVNYSFLVLEDLSFDAEGFETAESYKNLLKKMIKIAKIENKIKKINVVRKNHLINITVLISKNEELKYSVDINENQDWIDINFIEQFINSQLLPKTNITKKFLSLPAIDQIANLIFLSQIDFQRAKEIGLIPSEGIFIE